MQITEAADRFGVDAKALECWLGHIAERMSSASSQVDVAAAVAHAQSDLEHMLGELAVGESPRARVAGAFITMSVWYRAGGASPHAANRLAARAVLDDKRLADLRADGFVDRCLSSLGIDL